MKYPFVRGHSNGSTRSGMIFVRGTSPDQLFLVRASREGERLSAAKDESALAFLRPLASLPDAVSLAAGVRWDCGRF